MATVNLKPGYSGTTYTRRSHYDVAYQALVFFSEQHWKTGSGLGMRLADGWVLDERQHNGGCSYNNKLSKQEHTDFTDTIIMKLLDSYNIAWSSQVY